MRDSFPKAFVYVAFCVALLAAGLLGMVIEYNLNPGASNYSISAPVAHVTLMVEGGLTLGPDNQTHDSFVPCDFTVYSGQLVNLTILNYDGAPHSFTSSALNVNFQARESQTPGVPAVSNFQFTAGEPGVYRWYCNLPCDSETEGWAMTNGKDGQPGQIGYMGGFVTILKS